MITTTKDVEEAIFESLPPFALQPLDDVIFSLNFLILNFLGENCHDKTALLSSFQKHHMEPNNIIIFSGLSLQRSAHGRSQNFGFGAALKQKVQPHGRYISAATNFSVRFPRSLK